MGHITRLCWLPGGGAHKSGSDQGTGGGGNDTATTFPGTDGDALTRSPRYNEPRHRKLANGDEVVWCSKCSKWTDHFTAGHPTSNTNATENAGATPAGDGSSEETVEETDGDDTGESMQGSAFARLRLAGLI